MKLAEVLWGPEVWCQRAFVSGNRVCLMEGVRIVAGGTLFNATGEYNSAMQRIIRLTHGLGLGWNDDPARTWEEVARVVEEYDRLTMLEERS